MNKERTLAIFEYLIVLCLVLFVFFSDFQEITFHVDESHWIATSSYFDALLEGDFSSDTWRVSHATLTQPPAARYVIGLGRMIGGLSSSELNTIWDYSLSDQENAENGAIPSAELLYWSRFPMRVLASISILIGFFILRKVGGRIPGYIWIVLSLISQYFLLQLRRAMSESPLLFFIALILLVSYWILKNASHQQQSQLENKDASPPGGRMFVYFTMLGVLIGLAGAVKLNGLSALVGGIVLAVLAVSRYNISKTLKCRYAIIFIWIMVITSQAVFVAINPFLWRDLLNRIYRLFSTRLYEMNSQQQAFAEVRISGLSNRILMVGRSIFERYASLRFFGSIWVNLAFTIVGLIYVFRQFVNYFRNRFYNPAAVVILLVGFVTAGPSLLTPLDWDRYYLLPVFFTTLLICIGIWRVLSLLYQSIKKRFVGQGQPTG